MRIVLFMPSPHGERLLEPEYPEENPLGGSEASALLLAAALRRRGNDVEVVVEWDKLPRTGTEVLIAARVWEAVLSPEVGGDFRYFWAHDDADQERVAPLRDAAVAAALWERCDGAAFLSRYQRARYAGLLHLPLAAAPFGKAFLAGNGVAPGTVLPEAAANAPWPRPRRCYYASTPFRGLEALLRAWPLVRKAVPDAELAVFSSLRVYNAPDEGGHEPLYELARSLPGVTYHGAVGRRRLREEAGRCRALAYPCIFPETSCMTAMEAMAAGCAVVATELGALPETAWRNPLVDPTQPEWFAAWIYELCRVLTDDAHYTGLARQNLRAARAFDYDAEAGRWLDRIEFDRARRG